jgi:hypothetical protein
MLGNKINRTRSIVKIATTASPVSASTGLILLRQLPPQSLPIPWEINYWNFQGSVPKFQSTVHLIASARHRKQQVFMRELKKRQGTRTPISAAGDGRLSLDLSSALSAMNSFDQSAKQGGMLLEDDIMTKTKVP